MLTSLYAVTSRISTSVRRTAALAVVAVFSVALLVQGTWNPTSRVNVDNRESTTLQVYTSPEFADYGDSITLGAWITCGQEQPTGSLIFSDGAQVLATLPVTDTYVEYDAGKLNSGSHHIRAEYSGNNHCTAVTGDADLLIGCTVVVVTIASSQNPSTVGQLVTFTSTENCGFFAPVDFYIDGVLVATVNTGTGSTATYSTSTLSAGSHNVTASVFGSSASLTQIVGGPAVCIFGDGRINCRAEDAAQTAAIYCEPDGGVTLWNVLNGPGSGQFEFTATPDEINAVPKYPITNTLIKRLGGFSLWRLRGGYLQVNAPRDYVYIWQDC